jgi:cobalt-zinc-cadmium efflux system outer membrane protein
LANYEVAEEQLRLAVSQQYPRLALGTGIQLSVPLFSGFGQAAIETAQARREEASREFTARVHGARQEIAAEHALWGLLQRELELLEQQLLPNAEETLALSRASFGVGEVTLLETLELQRALVNARTRHIETRAARAQQAWKLLAASGWLLPADPAASRQPNANHASPNHEN